MLQYIQFASKEKYLRTKNYLGQFAAVMTEGMHIQFSFCTVFSSKDDGEGITPPNVPFKDDNIVQPILKVMR